MRYHWLPTVALCAGLTAGLAPAPVQAALPVRYLTVVQLGDSYSAGNGAGSNVSPPGCYRSTANWGSHYTKFLADQPATNAYVATSVEYRNAACSDAVMNDLRKGKGVLPRQFDSVPGADIVLMTIGGNDLGFVNLVAMCLTVAANSPDCKSAVNKARASLDDTGSSGFRRRLADVLVETSELARQKKPNARVVLAGYPNLVADVDLKLWSSVVLGIPQNEYAAGREGRAVAEKLEQVQQQAVADANGRLGSSTAVRFIGVRSEFDGYTPKPSPYLGTYSTSKYNKQRKGDNRLWGQLDTKDYKEYYHPNPAGQRSYARLIQALSLIHI